MGVALPDPNPRRVVVVTVVLVALLATGAVALSGFATVTGTVTLNATDGPAVAVDTGSSDTQLDTTSPFVDNNTVAVTATQGNATLSSPTPSTVSVDATELTGTRTRVTDVTTTGTLLTIDPADKRRVAVDGAVDTISFADATVDDTNPEFTYTLSGSSGTITLQSVGVTETSIRALDQQDNIVGSGSVDSTGTATVTLDASSATNVRLVTGDAPTLVSVSPQSKTARSDDFTLNASITDADFPLNDTVTVEFYDAKDDTQIATDTLTSNGTATGVFPSSRLLGGPNTWYVEIADQYGNTQQSADFTFLAPDQLTLRNESVPSEIVTTNASATVTFFGDSGQVIERQTTDGTIDMTGLPLGTTFTAQVEADGFVTRQSVIPSILEQQDVFLLPDNAQSVGVRFVLNDPTGQFGTDNTRVTISKPITRNNTTEFAVVAADVIGVGGFSTVLERDQRYLIEVQETETGNTRSLGPYVASQPEEVTLTISALDFEQQDANLGYEWGAEFTNETAPAVEFRFSSEPDTTVSSLSVNITNQAGNLTILDTSFTDPTTVTETAVIPAGVDTSGTVWVVTWQATIDGNTVSGSEVVGPGQLGVSIPQMSQGVLSAVSVLVLLMVAGLFSQANVAAGGVITALTAGGLYLVGALPPSASGLLVATALLVAILAYARTNQEIRPQ